MTDDIHPTAQELIVKYREYGYELAKPGTFGSVHELKEANRRSGRSWFGKQEMNAFATRDLRLHQGCVLSFSDRNFDDSERDYKIALLGSNGDVFSVIEPKFRTAPDAQHFAQVLAQHLVREREERPVTNYKPKDSTIQRMSARAADLREATDENWLDLEDVHEKSLELLALVEKHLSEVEAQEGAVLDVGPSVYHFPLEDGRALQVNVTDEGVILDAYDNDEHIGTRAMTAPEWFESIQGSIAPAVECPTCGGTGIDPEG